VETIPDFSDSGREGTKDERTIGEKLRLEILECIEGDTHG
jgi:hypothetical protein